MDLQHRLSGSALVAVVTFALGLACSESTTSGTGTDDGSSTTTVGAADMAGSVGASGTADSTGTADNAGTTGTADTTASTGTSDATTMAGDAADAQGSTGTTGTGGATAVDEGGSADAVGSMGGASNNAADGTAAGGAATSAATNDATNDVMSGGAATTGAAGGGSDVAAGGASSSGAGGSAAAAGGATASTDPMDTAPTAGCGSPAGLSGGRASIDVNGKMREYILYVPDNYDPQHPYKLVFGWHPWGGSAQQTESMGYFGLESVSEGQAILVAPEGQDFQDNGLGWGNADGEDIDFLHAMLDRFGSELCIDQNRIFSTGFSFGAMFSFTLACSQGSMMRAIAPQAGNATTSGRCEDGSRSVATMAFIGVDDSLLSGHRQAVDIFVERNGCSTEPVTQQASWCDGLASNFEPCTCVEYPDCNAGYPVIACEYQAGHQFAPTSGATIWNFFSQF